MVLLPTLALAALLGAMPDPAALRDVTAEPAVIRLEGLASRYSILTPGVEASGKVVDLTRAAGYRVLDSNVATVEERDVVRPLDHVG